MFFNFLPDEHQKTQIRTHLSSYLKWVSTYNPEFTKTLTTEDLANVWINEIEHPTWIENQIQQGNLPFLAHVNEYLHHYKNQAYLFEEVITPKFKPQENTTKTEPKIQTNQKRTDGITPKQLKYLVFLTKKHKRNIDLQHLTKKEASKLIDELVRLG